MEGSLKEKIETVVENERTIIEVRDFFVNHYRDPLFTSPKKSVDKSGWDQTAHALLQHLCLRVVGRCNTEDEMLLAIVLEAYFKHQDDTVRPAKMGKLLNWKSDNDNARASS